VFVLAVCVLLSQENTKGARRRALLRMQSQKYHFIHQVSPPLSGGNGSANGLTLNPIRNKLVCLQSLLHTGLDLCLCVNLTNNTQNFSYLGDSLVDVHSRTLLRGGNIIEIPLIYLCGIVLFPGETLPLRVSDARYREYFEASSELARHSAHDRGIVFGISCSINTGSGNRGDTPISYGTIAEICSKHVALDEVRIVARGRYRFVTISKRRENGIVWAVVEILEDEAAKPSTFSYDYFHANSRPFPSWVRRKHCPCFF
jgi:hypothetical protein